jgi:hypothetical protein
VLGGGGEAGLWFGWVPEGAATVWATVVGHQSIRDVPARTTGADAVGGATVWWVRLTDPVSAVSFQDAQGRMVERRVVRE